MEGVGGGGGGCCSGWPYDAMLWQECYETAWRQRLLKLGYWSSRAQSSNHRFLFCFSSHPETQAFTSFCFFLSRTLFPLPCFSKQLIFFFFFLVYIVASSSQPRWNALQHLDVFIHAHMFKSLCFSPFFCTIFPPNRLSVCCSSLCLSPPPCAQSPLKPLCSVSPLTTAVTLWPQFLRNRCAALWLDSRGRRKERKREGVGGGGGGGRRLRHWLVCGRHFVARW